VSLRVLLVLPIREGSFQVFPDLGILYLGSVLKREGHDVTMLDCPKENMTFSEFRTFVLQGNFDVVGFRCFSRDHNYVNHHTRIVKSINPRILTLVGGPHPSALPEFVLSNMDDLDFDGTIAGLVERRARKAVAMGVDGIVASPLEAAAVRRIVGPHTLIVTPGVRSAGADAADQKRVATPFQAIRDGADYVVIGRQIIRAADPAAAVDRILMELAVPA